MVYDQKKLKEEILDYWISNDCTLKEAAASIWESNDLGEMDKFTFWQVLQKEAPKYRLKHLMRSWRESNNI